MERKKAKEKLIEKFVMSEYDKILYESEEYK